MEADAAFARFLLEIRCDIAKTQCHEGLRKTENKRRNDGKLGTSLVGLPSNPNEYKVTTKSLEVIKTCGDHALASPALARYGRNMGVASDSSMDLRIQA
jgi:hypothetical protein